MPSYRYSGDMRDLGYALKDLISHLQKAPDSSDFLLYLLYSRTMAELAYSMIHEKENTGLYYLKKACGYIDRNIHETIRVPELAAYTGINKSYLQSLFSRILGCSIIEYINKKRLEEAAFLLINSSMSITDIAFSSGYNSRQHFAHTFEKYYGTGPLSYRKLHKRQMTAGHRKKPVHSERRQNFLPEINTMSQFSLRPPYTLKIVFPKTKVHRIFTCFICYMCYNTFVTRK